MKILHLFLITILSLMFMEQSLLAQNTDWPNFERYREDNIKLGLPRLGENRVVFMGNSITEGWKDVDLSLIHI